MQVMMKYFERLAAFPRSGRLVWIGLRASRNGPIEAVDEAAASPEAGLHGDRYRGGSGARQVTLIQMEHLAVIEALTGRSVTPSMLRRNLMVAGINLLALKNARFRIGEVLLEATGLCHPCSKMEVALGNGGLNAMRGHGGLTARVIEGGMMRLDDQVVPEGMESSGGPNCVRNRHP